MFVCVLGCLRYNFVYSKDWKASLLVWDWVTYLDEMSISSPNLQKVFSYFSSMFRIILSIYTMRSCHSSFTASGWIWAENRELYTSEFTLFLQPASQQVHSIGSHACPYHHSVSIVSDTWRALVHELLFSFSIFSLPFSSRTSLFFSDAYLSLFFCDNCICCYWCSYDMTMNDTCITCTHGYSEGICCVYFRNVPDMSSCSILCWTQLCHGLNSISLL